MTWCTWKRGRVIPTEVVHKLNLNSPRMHAGLLDKWQKALREDACVHGQRFATCDQARQVIMDWMAFYNYRRLHSSLGYLGPMQYEHRWYAAQRKKAA